MTIRSMLTTIDNPYDPFDKYDHWYAFDAQAGYHTPGLLARIAIVSDDLSDSDIHEILDQAMDEIVSENVLGVHLKLTRDVPDETEEKS